jgi:hypothetical protein
MKLILTTTLLSALSLSTCFGGPKEDVQAAVGKLTDAANYTWTSTTAIEGAQFGPGTVTGKAEKGGYAVLTQEREGNTTVAVRKGEMGVVKTDEGWKTAEQLRAAAQNGGGGGGGGGLRGAALLRSPLPGAEAALLADKAKELVAAEGAIGGDLTEAGAKEMMIIGRGRPGGQTPEVKNAKGSVKYWLKDGVVSKMQVKVSGTMAGRDGSDRDITRTTTYEFKDLGTTKVEVPEDAKKQLGS